MLQNIIKEMLLFAFSLEKSYNLERILFVEVKQTPRDDAILISNTKKKIEGLKENKTFLRSI